MINPAQITLKQPDGAFRNIIIEPILEKAGDHNLRDTGVYKIYKDAFGDETVLFTEPKEINETNNALPDEQNPDYLGKLTLNSLDWVYAGELLNADEQRQVGEFILNNA